MMPTQGELLEKLTVDELVELLFRLNIDPDNVALVRRRKPLAEAILRYFPSRPDEPLHMLGWDAVHALSGYGKQRGEGDVPVSIRAANGDKDLAWGLDALRLMGLAWRDHRSWHLLPEALPLIRRGVRKKQHLQHVDALIDLTLQAMAVYGAAPLETVVRCQFAVDGTQVDEASLEDHCDVLYSLISQRFGFYCSVTGDPQTGEPWLCSPLCEDPEALVQVLREGSGRDWFCPTKDQMAWLLDTVPMEADCARALEDRLLAELRTAGRHPDREQLREDFIDAFLFVQEGDLEGAEDVLLSIFPSGEGGRADSGLRFLVKQAAEAMPRWADHGFSRRRMVHAAAARLKPVGRNEPCPCGSGKKYKHCHGKLN